MININLDNINKQFFINYFNFLISQLYKSLCLKEEKSETLIEFLESLKCELIGSKDLIEFLKNDARFISLLSKIQFLISEKNIEHKKFKKEVFSSISLVEKLKDKYIS